MAEKVINTMKLDVTTTKEIFYSKIDPNLLNEGNECEVIISSKTTTAVNLAVNLALMKKKVLIVDMDGQANASKYVTKDFHRKLYNGTSITDRLEALSKNKGKTSKVEVKKHIHNIDMDSVKIDLLPATFALPRLLKYIRSKN